ncbi:replication initiation factor domain-containing protein [Enterococcus hulanensis]|uniref:Replication initiation factor domain-containing protein n=1 Tax=Enterococcus hulanensis TaxID=2559929 RepID=A0ABU3F1E5_9ENTE|nr:replication initiation factor domain-containing protein [Enterococcus hulanensis]MDT2600958.1 replication initiation factor domain-containing protein [Enterococcus hulanensis]MDT2611547.1 replication initiation factor domain-containing protein [Enterococcus hulanensis]MDT2617969.1 replication initiation factor domain-containing protein [Enterococcus hulanensis]MDT2628972.1 replication initiation factor domain-containing protein [Enterococcus hulanensis]MDT2656534.1 replication initiation fa
MLIDYVLISFIQTEVTSISEYFFSYLPNDWEILDSHVRGFQKMYTNRKIFVHYDNKGVKDTVLMEIRSNGCRFLEQETEHSWLFFFQQLSEIADTVSLEHFNVKRIDIAVDSFSKETLTPTRALDYLKRKLVTSRFQTSRLINEFRIKTTDVIGESLYFGKRTSDLSVLIYDKRLETKGETEWFRTEIRFRNSRAVKLLSALLNQPENFGAFVAEVLEKNIQFRSSYHMRSELRRQPLAKWYHIRRI